MGAIAGLGFPICRIVSIACLESSALLNAAIGKFNDKYARSGSLFEDRFKSSLI